jgi:hypothetical protein
VNINGNWERRVLDRLTIVPVPRSGKFLDSRDSRKWQKDRHGRQFTALNTFSRSTRGKRIVPLQATLNEHCVTLGAFYSNLTSTLHGTNPFESLGLFKASYRSQAVTPTIPVSPRHLVPTRSSKKQALLTQITQNIFLSKNAREHTLLQTVEAYTVSALI